MQAFAVEIDPLVIRTVQSIRQVFQTHGIDIVNLGLVYGVDIGDDSNVKIRMTLTSMGCPATGLIEFQAQEAVKTVDGVKDAVVEWTFDPPWSPDKMTEEGKDMIQAMGF